MGVDVLPLLTVGGASTIILGLASQQILANALNGVSIVSQGCIGCDPFVKRGF